MGRQRKTIPSCPAGLQECPVAAEVNRLNAECQRLSELSQTDPLTRLYNLQHLLAALDREMERTRRTKQSTALIMIDLDHFKRVNDTYGHQAGNEALRWASSIWKEKTRLIDICCRYGGEEFAIILPGTSLTQAVMTAERLRTILASSPLDLEGQPVKLTASFGVDIFRPSDHITIDDFIKRTDQFLLAAKAKGRNCVCWEESKTVRIPSEVTADERAALFITRWPQQN